MIRMLLPAGLLFLVSCAPVRSAAPQKAFAPGELEAARQEASNAIDHIDAYRADPLSAFEGPEIAAVEGDIAALQQETDEVRFVKEARELQRDWDALVGLDETLQQESAI